MAEKARATKPGSAEADFRRNIRAAVRGLWNDEFSQFAFVDSMYGTLRRGLTVAWHEGSRECGISPSEMTAEEASRLEEFINGQFQYLPKLATAITGGSKAAGGKLGPLYQRAEMWAIRYGEVKSLAMSMACGNKKLKWVWDPVKEHCPDCRRLNGRIYRRSIWEKYDIRPRMPRLACGGYRCGCFWEVTNDPVTPGRPPGI